MEINRFSTRIKVHRHDPEKCYTSRAAVAHFLEASKHSGSDSLLHIHTHQHSHLIFYHFQIKPVSNEEPQVSAEKETLSGDKLCKVYEY